MKIKTSMEIQEETYYSNENDDEFRNQKWVAVDDIYEEIDKCGQYLNDGQYEYDFVKIESLLSKLKGEKNE